VLCGGGGRGPGPYFRLEFLHGHGQFSHRLYERMRHVCPREQLVGYNGVIVQVTPRKPIRIAAQKTQTSAEKRLDVQRIMGGVVSRS
jgi:hypothetical protein